MCNFIIRPIKSYATVDVQSVDESLTIKRGDVLEVIKVQGNTVVVKRGEEEFGVNLELFIHAFTANPEDVKKVKDEEAKWFAKPKETKTKESK